MIKASLIIQGYKIETLIPTREKAIEWLNRKITCAEAKGYRIKSPSIKEVQTYEEQFGFLQGDACAAEWQAYS